MGRRFTPAIGGGVMRLLVLALLFTLPAAAQSVPQPPAADCQCGVPANPRGPR